MINKLGRRLPAGLSLPPAGISGRRFLAVLHPGVPWEGLQCQLSGLPSSQGLAFRLVMSSQLRLKNI